MSIKNPNDTIGNRTRDLPAFSVMTISDNDNKWSGSKDLKKIQAWPI